MFFVALDQGEVYSEDQPLTSIKKPTKVLPRSLNFISSSTALKQSEVIDLSLVRVPHLHQSGRSLVIINHKTLPSSKLTLLSGKPRCKVLSWHVTRARYAHDPHVQYVSRPWLALT